MTDDDEFDLPDSVPGSEKRQERNDQRKQTDTHANVRYFKMLEVAYNCARNGHYERSRNLAEQAISHYDETGFDDTVFDA